VAITPIEVRVIPSLTLTMNVYPIGNDTAAQTGIVLTEQTNRKGFYRGNITESISGHYTLSVLNSGNVIAVGDIFNLQDTTGLQYEQDLSDANIIKAGGNPTPIDGKSLESALQYIAAICAGKISGAGTGVENFLGLDGVTQRVSVAVDENGNRTGIFYD